MPFGKLKLTVNLKSSIRSLNKKLIKLFLGLYGALFRRNKEAAFSNYRLWESLGFVIAYVYSSAICTSTKLYIVISVLGLGTICYIIVEIRQLRKVVLVIISTKISIINDLIYFRNVSKRNLRRNSISQIFLTYQCKNKARKLKMKLMMRRTNWRKILSSLIYNINKINSFISCEKYYSLIYPQLIIINYKIENSNVLNRNYDYLEHE